MTQLIRFSPTIEAARMQREFDRLVHSFFPQQRSEDDAAESAVWTPRVDLLENDDAYLVHVDLPGVGKDDVTINYHEGILSISGDRRMAETAESDNCVRIERSYGRFFRSFTLPKAVDEDRIEASFSNGVLEVTAPKTEVSKPRRISIQ